MTYTVVIVGKDDVQDWLDANASSYDPTTHYLHVEKWIPSDSVLIVFGTP